MADEELSIRIKITDAARAIAEITGVEKAIKAVASTASKSTKELAAMSTQGLSTFSGLGRGIQSLTSNVMQYSRYAAVAAAGTVGFGLKTAGGLEQTNVAFKRMLGSQAAATAKIKELQQFAVQSPYDFQTIIGSARSLIAKGFDPGNIKETMRIIGDTVASVSDPSTVKETFNGISFVLGQLKTETKLNTRDILQFNTYGIDALKYLAAASGKTKQQVYDDIGNGLVPAAQSATAIMAGLDKDFGGMMAEQNKTMLGGLSNLVDAMKAKLYQVDENGKATGTLAPLVTLIERNLPHAADVLGKAMDHVGVMVQHFTDNISMLARAQKNGGTDNMLRQFGRLVGIGGVLVPIWKHIKDDSATMASIWRGSLWPAIQNVASIMGPFVMGTLKFLEGTLHWFADHPKVAEVIFTGLGVALATWAIEASLLGIAGAITKVATGFLAANAAILKFPWWLVKQATGIGTPPITGGDLETTLAKPKGKPLPKESIGDKAAKAGKSAGRFGFLAGAGAIGGLTAVAGAVGVGMRKLDPLWDAGQTGIGGVGFAGGGGPSMRGSYVVGEQGPELLTMPGGAQVTNNKELMKAMAGGGGRTVNFHENSVVVSGTDVLNADRVTDILVQKMNDRIARQ